MILKYQGAKYQLNLVSNFQKIKEMYFRTLGCHN